MKSGVYTGLAPGGRGGRLEKTYRISGIRLFVAGAVRALFLKNV